MSVGLSLGKLWQMTWLTGEDGTRADEGLGRASNSARLSLDKPRSPDPGSIAVSEPVKHSIRGPYRHIRGLPAIAILICNYANKIPAISGLVPLFCYLAINQSSSHFFLALGGSCA